MMVQLKLRPWSQRFIRSYLGWRKHLGIVMSLRAAWVIANAVPRAGSGCDQRVRPGRSWSTWADDGRQG